MAIFPFPVDRPGAGAPQRRALAHPAHPANRPHLPGLCRPLCAGRGVFAAQRASIGPRRGIATPTGPNAQEGPILRLYGHAGSSPAKTGRPPPLPSLWRRRSRALWHAPAPQSRPQSRPQYYRNVGEIWPQTIVMWGKSLS